MNAQPTTALLSHRIPAPRRERSLMCAALVRPGSALYQRVIGAPPPGGYVGSFPPAWGIYEYDHCYVQEQAHELRFGDGSWLRLDARDLADLVLLPEIDESALEALFP
jgi:hypothetical protein